MIRVYKGDLVSPLLYEVDARQWVTAGWSHTKPGKVEKELPAPKPKQVSPSAAVQKEARQKELLAMTWQQVKTIALSKKPAINKDEEESWDDMIPKILDREFPQK